jgi:hypothetical protein
MRNVRANKKSWGNALWPLCGIFAVGIGISILALVIACRGGSDLGMGLSCIAIGTFLLGISIIVMYKLDQFHQASEQRRKQRESKLIDANNPYVAQYSRQEGWLMLILSVLFLGCSVYVFGGWSLKGLVLFAGFAIFCIWRAAVIFITKITFTNQCIIARGLFFKKLSEPYSNITQMVFRFGLLTIAFSSGHSIKIRAGLGNAKISHAFLEKYGPSSVFPQTAVSKD